MVQESQHGQGFAFWTEKASLLLQGALQTVFRVPKATSSKPLPSPMRQVEEDCNEVEAEADRCFLVEVFAHGAESLPTSERSSGICTPLRSAKSVESNINNGHENSAMMAGLGPADGTLSLAAVSLVPGSKIIGTIKKYTCVKFVSLIISYRQYNHSLNRLSDFTRQAK
ncbi:putative LOC107372501-like protein [Xyrichtys novacula]|uniref:LOC107372501-like protein n=1 Tax=Xyrichtys novacula TaxID=13765 RepID=A0AAV1FIX9_XYRNO|nr:putative LOC107372501-like protein [Xyrichtys novacula]